MCRPLDMHMRAHRPMDSGIMSFKKRGKLTQIAGIEREIRIQLTLLTRVRARMPVCRSPQMAKAHPRAVSPRWPTRKLNRKIARTVWENAQIRILHVEGCLSRPQAEINAAVRNFEGGKQVQRWQVRSLQAAQQINDIPGSVCLPDKIQGGLLQPQTGKANFSGEQLIPSDARV